MNKRRKVSKTGYVGVYKNSRGALFHYDSYLSADPYKTNRKTVGGFKTAEEAYEAKKKYEDEVRKIIESGRNKSRVGFLADKYLGWKKTVVKITTYHHTQMIVKKYMNPYYDFSIEKFIGPNGIDKFKKDLINISSMTISHKNRILRVIKDIFEYGLSIDYVDIGSAKKVFLQTHPFVDSDPPKVKKRENYWSIDEWQKFIKGIDHNSKWYVFFALYGQLGCRIGEIRGLQNRHVHLDEGYIRIEQQALNNVGSGKTIISSTKTKNSVRDVTITPGMVKILKQYMRAHNAKEEPENFLFFQKWIPVGVSTVRRQFNYYVKQVGLPRITLHGIRHSNCTWLLSNKLTPQEIGQVSHRLGHGSVKETLDIYMHIHKEESSLIMKELDEIV